MSGSQMNMPMPVNEEERWAYLVALDEGLLKGGQLLSECALELLRNADVCYASGAYVAGIVMAAAAVETCLRSESSRNGKTTFFELIEQSGLPPEVVKEVHDLRRIRNGWVHVGDPFDDQKVLDEFEKGHPKLESDCRVAMRTVRLVLYSCPWV